jgi:hypothetical protein
MAKTSFIQIPVGDEHKFFKALQPGDRFTFPRIRRKNLFLSRKRKKGLTLRSLLPQISEAWAGLTTPQKEAWQTAADEMGQKAYKLFTQDQSARIKNEIAGVATPSTLHQSWVGKIQVDSPADYFKIAQYHPSTYFISRKMRGFDRSEAIKVVELVSLPLVLSISYKSNLTAIAGHTPVVRFFADVVSLYQGQQLHNILEVPLDLESGWYRATATLSHVTGIVNGYTLYIELDGVTGTLLFDNVNAYHNAQNWARDPWCNDINQQFTKVWFQIPKHWSPVDFPESSFYDSVYPED